MDIIDKNSVIFEAKIAQAEKTDYGIITDYENATDAGIDLNKIANIFIK